MPGNPNSNLQRAQAAWGASMPAWIAMLADACDRTNQTVAAQRLGKSSPYISRILRAQYPGDLDEAEKLVRATFSDERLICPLFGDMALATCMRNRRRPIPRFGANWTHEAFARTCPTCPNNTDLED